MRTGKAKRTTVEEFLIGCALGCLAVFWIAPVIVIGYFIFRAVFGP